MTDEALLEVLDEAVAAVRRDLADVDDWRPMTDRPSQYQIDVVADAAALEVILGAGLGAVSEESGTHHLDRRIIVVLDPVDGSTNASRQVPWYATSLCALDGDGPRAAVVTNQASGERFSAVRGRGAHLDGEPIGPTACTELSQSCLGVSGLPDRHWGWAQFRAFGSAALDLCAVACGRLDGYLDVGPGHHAPWDYLGALLVCHEAGALVVEATGAELVTLDPTARRAPVAAATPELLGELTAIPRGHGSYP